MNSTSGAYHLKHIYSVSEATCR